MGGTDDLGQVEHQPGALLGQRRPRPAGRAVPFADDPRQVAARDVLVLQAGGLGAQVRVPQRHQAGMLAVAHDPVQHRRLVAQQPVPGVRVQTELQGHRRDAGEVRVAGLPDLAEAAGAEQLLQLPIDAGQGPVAGPEG